MKNARILAIVLALLLALPAVAGAETGSYMLTLSDPVVEMTQGGETITQDLTGLALQLGVVMDGSAASAMGALSVVLLAQNEPAASAIIGVNGDVLYALASGISSVITMPLDQLTGVLEEQGALPVGVGDQIDAVANIGSLLEKIEFTEGPAEDVQFYNTTGHCPRVSAHLTTDELREICGDFAAVPDGATLDISSFMDDQGNVRIEGSLNNIISSTNEGERDLGYVLVAEMTGDAIEGGGWIGNDAGEVNMNFSGSMDEQFPDHPRFDLVAEVVELNDDDDDANQIQLQIAPVEADGGVATSVNAVVLEGDDVEGMFQGSFLSTDTAEDFWLYMGDDDEEEGFSLRYTGTVSRNDIGVSREGQVEFAYSDDGVTVNGSFNLASDETSDIEGKLPDISSMTQIQFDQITDEQMEQLMSEVQQQGISIMGKLMTVPSIASLLASVIQ